MRLNLCRQVSSGETLFLLRRGGNVTAWRARRENKRNKSHRSCGDRHIAVSRNDGDRRQGEGRRTSEAALSGLDEKDVCYQDSNTSEIYTRRLTLLAPAKGNSNRSR
jgi:hypothetical protein